MTKFKFVPPTNSAPEKIKLTLSPEVTAWADTVASQQPGVTREQVLEQAIAHVASEASRPVRQRKTKASGN